MAGESLKIKMSEQVLIEKVCQLFRNLLYETRASPGMKASKPRQN